jgi:hypothetical protein
MADVAEIEAATRQVRCDHKSCPLVAKASYNRASLLLFQAAVDHIHVFQLVFELREKKVRVETGVAEDNRLFH